MALKPVGYEIINLGNNDPHKLSEVIELIEMYTGKSAKIEKKDFHLADIKDTWAYIRKAKDILGWESQIKFEEGIKRTVNWFLDNWNWVKEIGYK